MFLRADGDGWRLEGDTAAVEEGRAWAVRYDISIDAGWATRSARVWGRASGLVLDYPGIAVRAA